MDARRGREALTRAVEGVERAQKRLDFAVKGLADALDDLQSAARQAAEQAAKGE